MILTVSQRISCVRVAKHQGNAAQDLDEGRDMLELFDQIEEAVQFIRQRWSGQPKAGIILGTGLGGLAEDIELEASLDYEEIPHFPRSTTVGHRGRFLCGRLQGVPTVAMEGRFHMYEGYSLRKITLPVRVMRASGRSC